MTSIDLDPSIKQALRQLHSNARDSTEQVRLLLDEVLRHTVGSSKTMANVLPKKYLAEERNENYQKHKHKGETSKSSSSKNVPLPAQSPQQIQIPERPDEDGVMDGDLTFELLEEDLTCTVCRQIAVQAGNRLVECDVCHALYHQDCHKPVISENDVGSGWQCTGCVKNTHGFGVNNVGSSKSGSSSVKSSPGKQTQSKSLPPLTGSSSKVVTPTINIISADKRLQIMKKKAAKQQENKRKHSK